MDAHVYFMFGSIIVITGPESSALELPAGDASALDIRQYPFPLLNVSISFGWMKLLSIKNTYTA